MTTKPPILQNRYLSAQTTERMEAGDFEQWRQRLIANDQRAWNQVLESSMHYCTTTLLRNTNCSTEQAQDLFSDAIIVFRENLITGKVENTENLPAYIYKICFFLWRNHQHEAKREQKYRDRLMQDYRESFNQLPVDPLVQQELIEEEENALRRKSEAMRATLKELGDQCQKILRFFYFQKRSMKEIAAELDFASADVAKTLKSRCYKNWLRLIEERLTA